ncbi:MAG: enoyl-CoA hydratase-related protein [Nitrospinota bacterium]
MSTGTVLYEATDGIGLITINRPEKMNAMTYATLDELAALLDRIEVDPEVRVVILTGAGEKAFIAGGDIGEFFESIEAGVEPALREFVRRGQSLLTRMERFPKPIIAAVNGYALGAGCEMIEALPLTIASEKARFGKPEINLGFHPPFGGTQRLARLVGRKRALRMILTGEMISAQEAHAMGLVNAVVPPESLMEEARKLAATIAEKPPVAVRTCLESVTRGLNMTVDEGLNLEASLFAQTAATQDIHEGIRAFLEKRKPQFTGT